MSTEVQTTKKTTLTDQMASEWGVDKEFLLSTLKETVFRGATNEQLMSLLIIANVYHLNPFLREIYAFPSSTMGIIPVVGIDGWLRIMNEHPQFDGVEVVISEDGKSATCTIYRKDRSKPVSITEYLSECDKGTSLWKKQPRRMLRHKAIIQCVRIAFGFGGIYDPDDGQAIYEQQKSENKASVKQQAELNIVSRLNARVVDISNNQEEVED